MTAPLAERLAGIMGCAVTRIAPLGGGCIADVRRAMMADGRDVVVKRGAGAESALAIEGRMLSYLAEHTALPVPTVHFAADDLLVMDYIPSGDPITPAAEADAAMHLAALHGIGNGTFGFSWPTVIGGLQQPNDPNPSWRDFFRDRRLLYMGRAAVDAGRLPAPTFRRLEKLCANLSRWIGDTSTPSLIHGDLWTGNILIRHDKLVGVVDPALYFADAEIELAFSTLFGTFGDSFFARYAELRPIAAGFFEERRDLYNLYPLLVHVRLFGGTYVNAVERTLNKFGF